MLRCHAREWERSSYLIARDGFGGSTIVFGLITFGPLFNARGFGTAGGFGFLRAPLCFAHPDDLGVDCSFDIWRSNT